MAWIQGSSIRLIRVGSRHVRRIVEGEILAVGQRHAVDDARRRRHEVEAELALQPLLHDLQVEQAEKAAAEAETQSGRALGIVMEARIVEPELGEALAQPLVVVRIDRKKPTEDHRHAGPKARQRRRRRSSDRGDRVAHVAVAHVLDGGGDEADLARSEAVDQRLLGREHADPLDLVLGAGGHHADLRARREPAVHDAHQNHHAEIGVVPAIHQQRRERRVLIALGRGQAGDERIQHGLDAQPGLGGDLHRARRVDADDVLDLLLHPLRLGRGEVHLVEQRDDLVVVVHRLIGVGESLGLHALGGVDDQERALACCQGAAHLVGEVDVAGGIHQIDDMLCAPGAAISEAHGLRLDRDATLALELHRIQHLAGHLALLQTAAALDQPVGEGRFAVIDVGDDRDVADACEVGHGSGPNPLPERKRGQPRSTPPVIFATLATIFAAAASISGSVSVRSCASSRTVIARDFLSASIPEPA